MPKVPGNRIISIGSPRILIFQSISTNIQWVEMNLKLNETRKQYIKLCFCEILSRRDSVSLAFSVDTLINVFLRGWKCDVKNWQHFFIAHSFRFLKLTVFFCFQLFREARRTSPCILYIPHIGNWWDVVAETLKATFISLLQDLEPTTPVLLLATAEIQHSELPDVVSTYLQSANIHTRYWDLLISNKYCRPYIQRLVAEKKFFFYPL